MIWYRMIWFEVIEATRAYCMDMGAWERIASDIETNFCSLSSSVRMNCVIISQDELVLFYGIEQSGLLNIKSIIAQHVASM